MLDLATVHELTKTELKPSDSKIHQLHFADAAIMAVMGYIAAENRALGAGRPPHQQDIITKMASLLKSAALRDTR